MQQSYELVCKALDKDESELSYFGDCIEADFDTWLKEVHTGKTIEGYWEWSAYKIGVFTSFHNLIHNKPKPGA